MQAKDQKEESLPQFVSWQLDENTNILNFTLTKCHQDLLNRLKYNRLYTLEEAKILLKQIINVTTKAAEEDLKNLMFLSRFRTERLYPKPIVSNWIDPEGKLLNTFQGKASTNNSKAATIPILSGFQLPEDIEKLFRQKSSEYNAQPTTKLNDVPVKDEDTRKSSRTNETNSTTKSNNSNNPQKQSNLDNAFPTHSMSSETSMELAKAVDHPKELPYQESMQLNGSQHLDSKQIIHEDLNRINRIDTNEKESDSNTRDQNITDHDTDETQSESLYDEEATSMSKTKEKLEGLVWRINQSLVKIIDSSLRQRRERLLLSATILEELESLPDLKKRLDDKFNFNK